MLFLHAAAGSIGAHTSPLPFCLHCLCCSHSDKESSRGDRAVWGTDGSGGVGLLGPGPAAAAAASKLDVKFAYDVVFSPSNSNGQVGVGMAVVKGKG